MRVVLHIGLPKCASSSIQYAFVSDRKALRRAGVRYPKTGRTRRGDPSHLGFFTVERGEAARLSARLERECRGDDTALVSTEALTSKARWEEALAVVVESLNERFGADRVDVLLLVRNHVDYAESCFAQFVRSGVLGVDKGRFYQRYEPTIHGFSEAYRDRWGHPFFSYSDIIRRTEACLGANQLEVMSIERRDLDAADIASALATRLGVDALGAVAPQNQRISAAQILALTLAQSRYGHRRYAQRRQELLRATEGIDAPGRSSRIHVAGALAREIVAAQEADRTTLVARRGRFDAVLEPRGEPQDLASDAAVLDRLEAIVAQVLG
ncbi:MAG: hypothetical protein AAF548_16265 [Actinomycetota bacterium]